MLVDRYTKIVLTVIAVALAALAVSQFVPAPVVAQGSSCGSPEDPCYVTNRGIDALWTR